MEPLRFLAALLSVLMLSRSLLVQAPGQVVGEAAAKVEAHLADARAYLALLTYERI